jgi:hypothetical protein
MVRCHGWWWWWWWDDETRSYWNIESRFLETPTLLTFPSNILKKSNARSLNLNRRKEPVCLVNSLERKAKCRANICVCENCDLWKVWWRVVFRCDSFAGYVNSNRWCGYADEKRSKILKRSAAVNRGWVNRPCGHCAIVWIWSLISWSIGPGPLSTTQKNKCQTPRIDKNVARPNLTVSTFQVPSMILPTWPTLLIFHWTRLASALNMSLDLHAIT